MKRRGPELEWWVESWGWEQSPPKWEFHSTHSDKQFAAACAAKQLKNWGGVWRVVEIARYPLQEYR